MLLLNTLVIMLWRQRLVSAASPVYAEILWHPEQGIRHIIDGLESHHRKGEVDQAWRALRTLLQVKPQLAGRKVGSVVVPDFPERYPAAYKVVAMRQDERPTPLDVAAELNISEATFYRYLDRFKLRWPPSNY